MLSRLDGRQKSWMILDEEEALDMSLESIRFI